MSGPCELCGMQTFSIGYCGSCSDDLREWDAKDGLRKINTRRARLDLQPLQSADISDRADRAQATDWAHR